MAGNEAATGGPLRVGAVLAGRYRLTELLGRGGMADVFSGEDMLLGRVVAVKVFGEDAASGADRRRAEFEMRTLAALDHPGLVTIFDAGTFVEADGRGRPYFVMEFVAGPTLARRLAADGPLSRAETAALGHAVADTLAYVHARGIVHRDVKPANILLPAEPPGAPFTGAKLADFGISRLVDATRLTLHGTTIGTPNYLSPEQAEGGNVGPASDIYSLGLVLIECLSGQVAYPGAGLPAALARLHQPPPVPPDAGPEWAALLTAMTSRDPALRPTAEQVAAALSTVAAGPAPIDALRTTQQAPVGAERADSTARLDQPAVLGPAGTVREQPVRAGRPWRNRWVYLAAAVLTAAAVVVLVLVATGGRSSRSPSPAPSYPAVSGPVGTHLRDLESAVG